MKVNRTCSYLEGEIIYFSGKLKAEIFPGINDNFEKGIVKIYALKT